MLLRITSRKNHKCCGRRERSKVCREVDRTDRESGGGRKGRTKEREGGGGGKRGQGKRRRDHHSHPIALSEVQCLVA